MKNSANQSLNCGYDKENLKPHHGGPSVDNPNCRQGAFKKCPFQNPQQIPLWVTEWMRASPHWSSQSRKSTKPLRVDPGWSIQNWSNMILPVSEQRTIALSIIARDTGLPIIGPYTSSWWSCLARISL